MSMKLEKRKAVTIAAVVIGLIVLVVALILALSGTKDNKKAPNKDKLYASNNAQRIEFLESFGWDVSDEPIEVCEIILPESMDNVYEKYNAIQKTQGMDLSKFMGRRAKRWTYMVLNYPSDDEVHANVIICEEKIIAGDICSVALGGFIHGFTPEEAGTLSESGLLAADLPTEFNGIELGQKKSDKNAASSEVAGDSSTAQKDSAGGESKDKTGGDTEGTGDKKGSDKDTVIEEDKQEVIDQIEQQAREEIENTLEMLIAAAEDKKSAG